MNWGVNAMKEMCADCPFGSSKQQMHMRRSLRKGRFNEICQSIWNGAYFPCHKTTTFDDGDDGDVLINRHKEKQCRGALEFIERIEENRRHAEERAKP